MTKFIYVFKLLFNTFKDFFFIVFHIHDKNAKFKVYFIETRVSQHLKIEAMKGTVDYKINRIQYFSLHSHL